MKLTGVEVPVSTLSKVDPKTVLLVIFDENEKVNVVKVDRDSISQGEPLVRVAGGCWVRNNGGYKWVNPCLN